MWGLAEVARAEERYDAELELQVSVFQVFSDDHHLGGRLALGPVRAVADHCDYLETECPGGPIWPLAGALLRADWRGGRRLGAELVGVAGVGDLDMHQSGYFPLTAAWVFAGPRLDLGAPPGLVVGILQGQRALAVDARPEPNVTSWRGLPFADFLLEGGVALRAGAPVPRLAAGLQGSFFAGDQE